MSVMTQKQVAGVHVPKEGGNRADNKKTSANRACTEEVSVLRSSSIRSDDFTAIKSEEEEEGRAEALVYPSLEVDTGGRTERIISETASQAGLYVGQAQAWHVE